MIFAEILASIILKDNLKVYSRSTLLSSIKMTSEIVESVNLFKRFQVNKRYTTTEFRPQLAAKSVHIWTFRATKSIRKKNLWSFMGTQLTKWAGSTSMHCTLVLFSFFFGKTFLEFAALLPACVVVKCTGSKVH